MNVVASLIGRILSRPAWLMALFLILACVIPFAGETTPFRGDSSQILDPFSFSLFLPTRHSFGPHEILALAGLLIIPALLIDWRRWMDQISVDVPIPAVPGWVYPFAAVAFYAFFLMLCLPLTARSSAFPGPVSIILTFIDLLVQASILAWIVDLSMNMTATARLRPLVAWMTAGAVHLGVSLSDIWFIAPQAQQLFEIGWTSLAWHGILTFIAITIHAFPIRTRATL
jgi:hypothetical protein